MKTITSFFPPRTRSILACFLSIGGILSFIHEFTPYLDFWGKPELVFFIWLFFLLASLYLNRLIEYVCLVKEVDKLIKQLKSAEKNRKGLIQQYNRSNKKIKSLKHYNILLLSEIKAYTSNLPEKDKVEAFNRILLERKITEVVQNGKLQSSKNNR